MLGQDERGDQASVCPAIRSAVRFTRWIVDDTGWNPEEYRPAGRATPKAEKTSRPLEVLRRLDGHEAEVP